jgi:TM2 domain-containing membrane protein YozV
VYAVVGSDGVVYGPLGPSELARWIADGRLNPDSELIDWQGRRLRAEAVPELASALAALAPLPGPEVAQGTKSRAAAIGLALTLGPFGAHRYYLGHRASATAMLLLGIVTLGLGSSVWALIDVGLIATGRLGAADGSRLA